MNRVFYAVQRLLPDDLSDWVTVWETEEDMSLAFEYFNARKKSIPDGAKLRIVSIKILSTTEKKVKS